MRGVLLAYAPGRRCCGIVWHVPVVARVEWEHDGEEQRETTAYAWAPGQILVLWHDQRRATIGIWLPTEDVEKI